MPLETSIPYGLRDVKLIPYTNGTAGTPIDLPNSRTFSFEESEDFEELRGDDRVVATRGQGASVGWELEAGGISLEAYAVMNGGVVTISGTGPTEKKTYVKKASDVKPRFGIEGQALSESGGDFHCSMTNCKASEGLDGELSDGSFWLTSASGSAIADPVTEELYTFTQNAAVTPIAVV